MAQRADFAALTGADIKANVRRVAAEIRDRNLAPEFDRDRKLPKDIVEQLRAAGVFRMNMPRIWGGPEMTSMEQVEVVEELSRADGSVGWCSFIWCDSGLYSGYLDDSVARALYPKLDMAQSGWVYPAVPAIRVDGGYRVSGRWIFGSGSNHCDMLAAGVIEMKDGAPMIGADGSPGVAHPACNARQLHDRRHLVHDRTARHRQQRLRRQRSFRAV